jgi:hypothetical protein
MLVQRITRELSVVGLAWVVSAVAPACAHAQAPVSSPQTPISSELSLHKAGELQEPTDLDDRAAPIKAPQPVSQETMEKAATMPPPPPPVVPRPLPNEVMALDSNLSAKVNDVLACRLEIASDRRVRLEDVPADQILLRWTVQPGGGVANAEAVAEKSTDPDVLSCAKRKMETWMFVRSPGGEPLPVEQSVQF